MLPDSGTETGWNICRINRQLPIKRFTTFGPSNMKNSAVPELCGLYLIIFYKAEFPLAHQEFCSWKKLYNLTMSN